MATYQPYVTMNSCCAPLMPECVDCPIIVSCDPNLVIHPGQLKFCPDNAKYYYNSAGQYKCLNPSWGLGLGMDANCEVKVKLADWSALYFDDFGAIAIDCERLIRCCELVTQEQLNTVLDIVRGKLPKGCDGQLLDANDRVFTLGSLKKLGVAGVIDLLCNDIVLTYGDLRKCVNGVLVPLEKGDIVQVAVDCVPLVPVGSPPVGSPPVGSPPVGSPPVGGGGCCDLVNDGPKSYVATFSGGTQIGSTAPVWSFSYPCANNEYIPFYIGLTSGTMPPGLSLNGVSPTSDGSNHYYFQGFGGSISPPASTTVYNFTIEVRPFSSGNACVSYADITYTVNVGGGGGGGAPVGSPPDIGGA